MCSVSARWWVYGRDAVGDGLQHVCRSVYGHDGRCFQAVQQRAENPWSESAPASGSVTTAHKLQHGSCSEEGASVYPRSRWGRASPSGRLIPALKGCGSTNSVSCSPTCLQLCCKYRPGHWDINFEV